MQSLDDMLAFARVVEEKGFTPAARALGISRSSLSKRISRLEGELSVRLLNRTTRRLSLTEAGDILYGHCAEMAARAEEGAAQVQKLHSVPSGELKISAPVFLGPALVEAMTTELLEQHPELSLKLELTDEVVDIVGGGYDVVIRVGIPQTSSLVARRIATTRIRVVAAPGYFERRGKPATPADLADHDCINIVRGGNPQRTWQLEGPEGLVPTRVQGRFETNNDIALESALLLGLGIGYVPDFIVARHLSEGRLETALEGWSRTQRGIYAVFPHRHHMPLKLRTFLNFVEDFARRAWPDRE